MLTTTQELKGHEEKKGTRREKSVAHENIIGGGQGGFGLAARLRRLGVPTLVFEKNQKPGDSWRNRYKSLHLHDPSGTTTCPT